MVNGRQKGATAEREVAAILFDELGLNFKRDLEQYRSADHGDLLCDDPDFPFCVEVKRYKTGCSASPLWWDQVKKAATACGKQPLLVYRYNHQDWKWRMPAQSLVDLGHPPGNIGMPEEATLDWNYAVEMDTRTAMMLIREVLSDG
jgi:Holliday junction resolvase